MPRKTVGDLIVQRVREERQLLKCVVLLEQTGDVLGSDGAQSVRIDREAHQGHIRREDDGKRPNPVVPDRVLSDVQGSQRLVLQQRSRERERAVGADAVVHQRQAVNLRVALQLLGESMRSLVAKVDSLDLHLVLRREDSAMVAPLPRL
eukprot:CAMPEP_0182814320 /NCGR_PEP_ID=MMETSP0006_2-20121128/9798_1 /TAXON_ID=97485 /ORGANISM="Prymnesium parvum, Strain Texoma1" /LENGTH=148 /DNA_ID=CAMNT_0024940451 /DNA_START=1026 /DNA_END=1473 /DNA_ORIENTATION=-